MPHQGVGFGAFARELGLPLPNVCFNYLGQLTSPDEKDWALVMSPVGETCHPDNGLPFGITLFSYIEQGRLQLEVVSGLSGEQNQQLLEAWEAAIDTLIACCERQEEPNTALAISSMLRMNATYSIYLCRAVPKTATALP